MLFLLTATALAATAPKPAPLPTPAPSPSLSAEELADHQEDALRAQEALLDDLGRRWLTAREAYQTVESELAGVIAEQPGQAVSPGLNEQEISTVRAAAAINQRLESLRLELFALEDELRQRQAQGFDSDRLRELGPIVVERRSLVIALEAEAQSLEEQSRQEVQRRELQAHQEAQDRERLIGDLGQQHESLGRELAGIEASIDRESRRRDELDEGLGAGLTTQY